MLQIVDIDTTPIVVDLDGTLVRSDLLHESVFDALSRHGARALGRSLFSDLRKQAIKRHFADLADIDYAALPYNEDVLALIVTTKQNGRPVYLATAAARRHAEGVAAHLGLFDGVFCSDDAVNLGGPHKAEALVGAFGEGGFDYVGNGSEDLAIWRVARSAVAVEASRTTTSALRRLHPDFDHLQGRAVSAKLLARLLRVHQYAKNALIFIPLVTSHSFDFASLLLALTAFAAFCACASGVYILNDLLDIQADRAHPSKRRRPFASGDVSIATGVMLFPLLTVLAFGLAALVSPAFAVVLGVYLALTTAYSFSLKRKMVVDVVTLAMLYTIRVIAGAIAIGVALSPWLFAFSTLIFTALALVKRYVELSMRLDAGLPDPSNRNYRIGDLQVIAALAAAAGMNAITVLALYVSSPNVAALYSRPEILWGLCPLMLYWVARMLLMAHRRLMHDDPIVFAIRDRRSWAVGAGCLVVLFGAL
ncbi:4-hydroxybenzoate polyprenyltransferase/phosphoglycolate phosphatase-like HAD superfamily hydrolase [Rhizobium sp. SG_E_25_P2]|uniref:UbiA family prenyltransferase n=1 Tax=Rhizobium sp. SG_E_25_P2 TaxID=2879942 RepID=UPI0024759B26|nr:UbiA family prenyltransferase [Rhizobium sp. SG_E_25_P2]MDH6268510.1 4-hydroxybenzoate polyprenyltransferase/phosphoglycolate phosphatase-like HAD superfamily hydrolase [Rhizobium sp. SG_E_25_P2]